MLGDAFPELRKPGALEHVVEILKDEELTFNQTLERGCREFGEHRVDVCVGAQQVLFSLSVLSLLLRILPALLVLLSVLPVLSSLFLR